MISADRRHGTFGLDVRGVPVQLGFRFILVGDRCGSSVSAGFSIFHGFLDLFECVDFCVYNVDSQCVVVEFAGFALLVLVLGTRMMND